MTSSVEFFTAAGVHGYYGMSVLEIGSGWTRAEAVRNLLAKVESRLQIDDKEQLRGEVEGIVAFLQTHDRWNGGDSDDKSILDEYLHIVVDCVDLELSSFTLTKKRKTK